MELIIALIAIYKPSDLEIILRGLKTLAILIAFNLLSFLAVSPLAKKFVSPKQTIVKSRILEYYLK